MPRYLDAIEDANGDLVSLDIYCSATCFRERTGKDPYGHEWPVPEKTDYRQFCPNCERVVVAAIDERSFDGWPDPPEPF